MKKVEKLVKKIVYTGVGFVSLTADKVKKTIDGLVEDGKISEEEGKKIVTDFKKNTDIKKDELELELKAIVEKALKTFNFVKGDRFDKLDKRVSMLETMLLDKPKKEQKPKSDNKKSKK